MPSPQVPNRYEKQSHGTGREIFVASGRAVVGFRAFMGRSTNNRKR